MTIVSSLASYIRKRPVAVIAIISVFEGFLAVLHSLGADRFNPIFFIGATNLILALVLWPSAGSLKKLITHRKGVPFIVSNLLVLVVDGAYILGIFYAGVGTMSLIALLKPVLIYIGGLWFLHEHAEKKGVVGTIVALLGASIFVLGGASSGEDQEFIGILLLLVSMIAGAALILYSKRLRADFSSQQILVMRNLPMGAMMAIGALVWSPQITWAPIDWVILVASGALGAVSAGVYFGAIAYAPITRIASLSYITRFTGLAGAIIFLNEVLSLSVVAGGAVVMAGLLIAHPVHLHRYHYHLRHHHHWRERFKIGSFEDGATK